MSDFADGAGAWIGELAPSGEGTEVVALAHSCDGMLDRLERAAQLQNQPRAPNAACDPADEPRGAPRSTGPVGARLPDRARTFE